MERFTPFSQGENLANSQALIRKLRLPEKSPFLPLQAMFYCLTGAKVGGGRSFAA
jgi:hypothetical protein